MNTSSNLSTLTLGWNSRIFTGINMSTVTSRLLNSLLVKCSEAGNVAAWFLLGKVILVSTFQLLLCKWQKEERDSHICDFANLGEISCILATNVPAQECKAGSFLAYFLPKQVVTSELSQTRLVHHQLVKLFLLNGGPSDFIEMVVFLKSYIKYYARGTVKQMSNRLDEAHCTP